MKEVFPTVVLNESVVDHTTRALIALNLFGYTEARNPRIAKAISWVKDQRLEDGSWKYPTYIGVVFPLVQYMRYPIFQEASTLGVLGMYSQDRDHFLSPTDPERKKDLAL